MCCVSLNRPFLIVFRLRTDYDQYSARHCNTGTPRMPASIAQPCEITWPPHMCACMTASLRFRCVDRAHSEMVHMPGGTTALNCDCMLGHCSLESLPEVILVKPYYVHWDKYALETTTRALVALPAGRDMGETLTWNSASNLALSAGFCSGDTWKSTCREAVWHRSIQPTRHETDHQPLSGGITAQPITPCSGLQMAWVLPHTSCNCSATAPGCSTCCRPHAMLQCRLSMVMSQGSARRSAGHTANIRC
jgi:hypothetical protein